MSVYTPLYCTLTDFNAPLSRGHSLLRATSTEECNHSEPSLSKQVFKVKRQKPLGVDQHKQKRGEVKAREVICSFILSFSSLFSLSHKNIYELHKHFNSCHTYLVVHFILSTAASNINPVCL